MDANDAAESAAVVVEEESPPSDAESVSKQKAVLRRMAMRGKFSFEQRVEGTKMLLDSVRDFVVNEEFKGKERGTLDQEWIDALDAADEAEAGMEKFKALINKDFEALESILLSSEFTKADVMKAALTKINTTMNSKVSPLASLRQSSQSLTQLLNQKKKQNSEFVKKHKTKCDWLTGKPVGPIPNFTNHHKFLL